MWKNKPVSDVGAFQQAIEPFIETYTIVRQAIRSYNERGRTDNVAIKDTIRAFIQPSGSKQLNTNSNGLGRQVKESYTLYAVVPEYVSVGDMIGTPYWGALKVSSVNDQRYQGVITAELVRTSTTQSSTTVDNKLYEPE